jgi:hypothetical protein
MKAAVTWKSNAACAGVLIAVAFGIPSEALAAPVRECGNAGSMYGGAVQLVNVTTRNVGCRRARRFVRAFEKNSGPESDFTCSEDFVCEWRGWHCRNDGRRRGELDHRCWRGSRVIRWQARSS